MNKRERVLAALDKKPVDLVPVSFWYHFTGEEMFGDACVQAHLKHYRDNDLDFIKIMSDGCEYTFSTPIRKAEDWYHLKPLGKDHPWITEQVKRARALRDAVGDECCLFYTVFNPYHTLRECPDSDEDMVAAHILENERAVRAGMDVIGEDTAILAEALLLEGGMDGIYFAMQGAEENRLRSSDVYRRMAMPSDLAVLELANEYSSYNLLHMCGWFESKNRMDLWSKYPAKGYNWSTEVEGISLREGAELFGGCVIGGFEKNDYGLLYSGTKGEIEAYAKALVKGFGKTGLIVGADCTIPNTIDKQRFRWAVDAVHQL